MSEVLMLGNCLETLKDIPDNSVDAIVTDPPYGLSFMGKKWDYDVPSIEIWKEALRVLKPGGHLLSFGGTRTYHRLVVAIEDAGFEIRDCIQWLYGSGFPKSTDVSKRIDKEAGAEREVIGEAKKSGSSSIAFQSEDKTTAGQHYDSAPSTDEAKQWQGWGTALKPANEPICVARKPLEKGLTVAENVLKWGTGAINIDASRIGTDKIEKGRAGRGVAELTSYHNGLKPTEEKEFVQGRWPANIILDEAAAELLDEQTKHLHGAGHKRDEGTSEQTASGGVTSYQLGQNPRNGMRFGDTGGASRFFYVAKASKSERNKGTDLNNHPTVKPIKLMQHLIKLVTPPNGIVLDPFMGSGSTGVAAKTLGYVFIGCEMSEEYFKIAKKRIEG